MNLSEFRERTKADPAPLALLSVETFHSLVSLACAVDTFLSVGDTTWSRADLDRHLRAIKDGVEREVVA